MGLQNLLCNPPFPLHPYSSQIKCTIHIQSSFFCSIVVILFFFINLKSLKQPISTNETRLLSNEIQIYQVIHLLIN
jgi:hypothetical protein